jgi:uncharacterized RDD family membrane protein YckC
MDTAMAGATARSPAGSALAGAAGEGMARAAGFWLRFWAWLFDTAILAVVVAVLSYLVKLAFGVALVSFLVGLVERGMAGNLGGAVALLAFLLTWLIVVVVSWLLGQFIGWIYYAFFESSSLQATPGKRFLSLSVVDHANRRISFLRATLRHVLKFAWIFPAIVAFLLLVTRAGAGAHGQAGAALSMFALSLLLAPLLFVVFYGMAGWTSRKQALHDVLSGCYVIRSRELAPGKAFALALASVVVFLAVHIALKSAGVYRTTATEQPPETTRV